MWLELKVCSLFSLEEVHFQVWLKYIAERNFPEIKGTFGLLKGSLVTLPATRPGVKSDSHYGLRDPTD